MKTKSFLVVAMLSASAAMSFNAGAADVPAKPATDPTASVAPAKPGKPVVKPHSHVAEKMGAQAAKAGAADAKTQKKPVHDHAKMHKQA